MKTAGDEIWACAEAKFKGATVNTVMQPAAPAAAPSPAASEQPAGISACDRMFKCYADLSTLVCEGNTDASCKSQFEIKITGTPTDATCKETLSNVHFIIEPFKAVRVDFKVPAICNL